MRVLYLHFVLLLAFFTSCEATATTKGGCPVSRLQAAFQAPFNSLSVALHGQQATMSSLTARDRSSSQPITAGNVGAPRWVSMGVRSRIVRSRTVDVKPLGMSAVETKQGNKRAAEGEPEEAKETKAQKKARRIAASSTPLSVHVIGLSHHNAGVDVRERLAVPEAEWNLASAKVCMFVYWCFRRLQRHYDRCRFSRCCSRSIVKLSCRVLFLRALSENGVVRL